MASPGGGGSAAGFEFHLRSLHFSPAVSLSFNSLSQLLPFSALSLGTLLLSLPSYLSRILVLHSSHCNDDDKPFMGEKLNHRTLMKDMGTLAPSPSCIHSFLESVR